MARFFILEFANWRIANLNSSISKSVNRDFLRRFFGCQRRDPRAHFL